MYEFDVKEIKLKLCNGNVVKAVISYCDNLYDDPENCLVELTSEDINISVKKENFFYCLLEIRAILEEKGILIMCNGAARSVYPSNMALNMGSSLRAYKLQLYDKGSVSDLVNIFDLDETLDFVTIAEQKEFLKEWLSSNGYKIL